jgi:RNA polymerase sigma factor (sigma-70 family)
LADTQRPAAQFAIPAAAGAWPCAPGESEGPLKAWFDRVVGEVIRAGATTRHDAEDATMKAIGEMLRAVEPGNHSLAYVRKAAINNFIKEKTRYRGRVLLHLDDPHHDQRVEGVEDHRLSECERKAWLEDVLSKLPPRQREVMECYCAGLSNKEIARKLGKSDVAVRRNLSDARTSLRKLPRADGEYRQPSAPAMVQGRSVSRAADQAIAVSASLAAPHRDLRAMSPAERAETAATAEELRELLRRCPAGAFGAAGSAAVLASVAAMATARIADRDELAALKLIRTAHPHLAFVGRHQAACDLQRARAEALCELGHPRWAQSLLRGLSETERQVFGADNPRTAMLLLWAQAMSGQLLEAETGFRDLEARLAQSQDSGTLTLWHVQCRHFWLRGACGQAGESAGGYDRVIRNRSRKLGSDDSDTLDGGHSKGKMLVVNGAGSQAITILQAVADDRARVQGDHHSDTLETLKYLHLAPVLAEPRDDRALNSAIVILEQILRTQASRHGPRYPMSRDTAAWLSWLRQGREAARFGEPVPSRQQFRTR